MKIVACGASEGGIQALMSIVSRLPADFAGSLAIVQHLGSVESSLADLLHDAGPLPASFARQGEPIEPGKVYVAPPDHHFLISGGRVELNRGPRENWARPAIDPLFRSVAETYRSDAIGVILTGNLNDGTLGLYEIKRRGGIGIVQDPDEAEVAAMPRSALLNVDVDFKVTVSEIPGLLVRLLKEGARESRSEVAEMSANHELDEPVALTCPECGGAMRLVTQGKIISYHCHIGHRMTGEVLSHLQAGKIEETLSAALRSLNERVELCRTMQLRAREAGETTEAVSWAAAEKEAEASRRKIETLVWEGLITKAS